MFNKLKKLFNNVNLYFKRLGGTSLEYVNESKKYGNSVEEEVYSKLKSLLPYATVLRSVCLDTDKAK